MKLSDLSIRRPVFAWVLMFSLIFFGVMAFQKLGINLNPDVEYPTISIRYSYSGASPSVVDKDIIEPVESVLVSMEGIKSMTSEAERGGGRIRLEFDLRRDIDFALQEVNTLLTRAQRNLPKEVEPPVVSKTNADDDPILRLVLTSKDLSFRDLMILFRDRIQDQISTVEGVGEVDAFGYHEPLLRVDLNANRLRQFQLTPSDIVASLQREHSELPAGRFEFGDQERLLRVMGEAESPEDFKDLPISRRGGSPNYQRLTLDQVAKIYEGTENIRRYSRQNQVPSLGMAVRKQRGVNAVATADRVKEKIEEINRYLPSGTELKVNFDATKFIRDSISELIFTLILSALLTSLVCWLFVGSFSAASNLLLAIPTAIVGTFIFLYLLGFTLNTFSILGLALAIGIVVDDAIVMLENITRYMQLGYNRLEASVLGAREISFAVIATTVALISIFLPITFLGGLEGRFFFEFAVTISIAVALSSLEALTLAPMRCSKFLTIGPRTTWLGKKFEKLLDKIRQGYSKSLDRVLEFPRTFTLGSILLFTLSLGILKWMPTELEPPQDRGAMFVIFIAPEGSSLQYTDEKIKAFEKIVLEHPDVKSFVTSVGGFGSGGEGNRGNGVIVLSDRDQREKSQFDIATEIRSRTREVSGIRIIVRDRFGSPLSGRRGSPIEFTISGPDPEVQRELFFRLKNQMDEDADILDTRSNDVDLIPEIHFIPDRKKAAERGVEVASIAEAINLAVGGVTATQYTQDGRRFDVFVQLEEKNRRQKSDLKDLLIRNNRGELLPLLEVVEIKESFGPQKIYREDRVKGIRVDASIAQGGRLGDQVKKIETWASEILPEDYFVKFSESPAEKLWDALIIMALGLLVAYLILAIQFNSFIDSALVFLAVPFGITGSVLFLFMAQQSLNLFSAIGILLTMGIVMKNSILLIEFTNQLRDQGLEVIDAIKQACRTRLRPILMTNLATLSAALPPALALGPGAETRIPMAIAILGGVALSVVFTVYIVPCAYFWLRPRRALPLAIEAIQKRESA
jgi:HAE1 family hydrophobic/amphiphilic exporter-1